MSQQYGNPGATGSAMLDHPPSSPSDKIYKKPTPPGSDTESLLGGDQADEDESNPALSTPGNKLLLSQAMFMQAINLRESVAPGTTPPQFIQWVAVQQDQVPLMAEQMARGGNPGALLSAVGQSTGTPSGPATGVPAMTSGGGMPGAGGGVGGMGGGSMLPQRGM